MQNIPQYPAAHPALRRVTQFLLLTRVTRCLHSEQLNSHLMEKQINSAIYIRRRCFNEVPGPLCGYWSPEGSVEVYRLWHRKWWRPRWVPPLKRQVSAYQTIWLVRMTLKPIVIGKLRSRSYSRGNQSKQVSGQGRDLSEDMQGEK